MIIERFAGRAPWEERYGYCRVVRAGSWALTAGTTATGPDGVLHPGDPYAQTLAAFCIALDALEAAGVPRCAGGPDPDVRHRHRRPGAGRRAPIASCSAPPGRSRRWSRSARWPTRTSDRGRGRGVPGRLRRMIGTLHGIVIDCADPDSLASFYAELLGMERVQDEGDWIVIGDAADRPGLAFERVTNYRPPTWPEGDGRSTGTSTYGSTILMPPSRPLSRSARPGCPGAARPPGSSPTRRAPVLPAPAGAAEVVRRCDSWCSG